MLDLRKIDFETYKNACFAFNQDTKSWYNLDENKFYTNTDIGNWKESSDNENGGFDVSWCFGLEKEKIEKQVKDKYNKYLKSEIEFIYENEIALNTWTKIEIQQYLKWIIDALL